MGISFLGDVAFLVGLFAFFGIVVWFGRSHGLMVCSLLSIGNRYI